MEAIRQIISDWRANRLNTNEAAERIAERLACSSMSFGAIMTIANELPDEIIEEMNK